MRDCKKGYSCGGSCISVTYECLKNFPDGVSVSLDEGREVITSMSINANPKPQAKKLLEPTKRPLSEEEVERIKQKFTDVNDEGFSEFTNKTIVLYDSPDSKNQTSVELNYFTGTGEWEVSFTINGDYDTLDEMSKKEKLAAGKNVKQNWNKILEEFPEGAVFTQLVYDGDGHGKNRARAYQKNGFRMFGNEPEGYYGFAMKVGSKLVPYTPERETESPVEFSEAPEATDADFYTMVTGEEIE